MNHADHVRLIERGIERDGGGRWADFGAGSGAFTLVLCDIAGPEVEIWSVDRDERALREARAAVQRSFPGTRLRTLVADFNAPLDLPPLDGIVSANAIHFVRDRVALLAGWRGLLRPGGA